MGAFQSGQGAKGEGDRINTCKVCKEKYWALNNFGTPDVCDDCLASPKYLEILKKELMGPEKSK